MQLVGFFIDNEHPKLILSVDSVVDLGGNWGQLPPCFSVIDLTPTIGNAAPLFYEIKFDILTANYFNRSRNYPETKYNIGNFNQLSKVYKRPPLSSAPMGVGGLTI